MSPAPSLASSKRWWNECHVAGHRLMCLGLVSKHLEGCGSRVREEPEVRQQGWASREAPHRRRGLGTIALSPVLRIPEPSPVTSTISV